MSLWFQYFYYHAYVDCFLVVIDCHILVAPNFQTIDDDDKCISSPLFNGKKNTRL